MKASIKTQRHQRLRRMHEAATRDGNVDRFYEDCHTMFNEGGFDLSRDFSVKTMFEQFVDDGAELVHNHFGSPTDRARFVEAAGYVDTASFANIMGQWAYTATLQGYMRPELVGEQLVTVIPTQLSGERIPGIGRIGDDVEIVGEGNPYPNATFGEEYIDTPETIKRGLILNISKEAIFFDRTGMLQQEAGKLGERIAVNREKRILDAVCGIVTLYRRNGAAAVATYGSDNTKSSNALVDWTSLDAMDQLFNLMTDPTTGEPIMITPDVLLVPKALENTARRIVNATMVRQGTNSGNNQTYTNGAQLNQSVNIVTGAYVRNRTSSDTTYFYGRPKDAFVYMENWPLNVIQAPANNELDFTSDIVTRLKATERGAPAVRDRKYMAKGTP